MSFFTHQNLNSMNVFIIISILFIALGVFILSGKGDFLIAGYNTASKEEKKRVNIKRLRLVIAVILFSVVLLFVPSLIGKEDSAPAHLVSSLCFVVVAFVGIILANTWCKKK